MSLKLLLIVLERASLDYARTTAEQLRLIRTRPGKSADETARLMDLRALKKVIL